MEQLEVNPDRIGTNFSQSKTYNSERRKCKVQGFAILYYFETVFEAYTNCRFNGIRYK